MSDDSVLSYSINDTNIPDELFLPLSEEEKSSVEIMRKSKTFIQDAWERFKKNPLAMLGLVVLGIIILMAIFGPIFSQYTYDGQELKNQYALPSSTHWFGTDKFGRDLFVRVLYGARISLTIGFCAALINFTIGVIYGGISGYFGGKTDLFMLRLMDIISGVPSLCYTIIIMMFLGSNIFSILVAISTTYWIKTARVVRSQVLTLKNLEYVMAAKTIGEPTKDIIFKHLIPNSMGPIIVTVTFLIPEAIFMEAFLSFLGIGISIPMASWGTLANSGKEMLSKFPHLMFFPAMAIVITMFALNFIGDGLRDSLDPRLKNK